MFNKLDLTPIGCVTNLLPKIVGRGLVSNLLLTILRILEELKPVNVQIIKRKCETKYSVILSQLSEENIFQQSRFCSEFFYIWFFFQMTLYSYLGFSSAFPLIQSDIFFDISGTQDPYFVLLKGTEFFVFLFLLVLI